MLLRIVSVIACLLPLPAVAAQFPLAPGETVVGAVAHYTTRPGDNLLDLARRYDLGYAQIVAANPGVDPWQPGAGRDIVIPGLYMLPHAPRRGIVVNLAQHRLFYFPPGGDRVETYPVGVAVAGLDSPLGVTRIVAKVAQPTWYPPASILAERPWLPHAIPPGPDDPLGAYALFLGWRNYLIHGTNKPDGVGRNVSHGCLHLYPEDIDRLFHEVAIGTPVRVIDEETEVQWIGGRLFVEVYPGKAQTDALDTGEPMPPEAPLDLVPRITAAAGHELGRVDWAAVERAGRERAGLPVPVTPPPALEEAAGGPLP